MNRDPFDSLVTALHCLTDRPEFATVVACRVFAHNCASGFEMGSPALVGGTPAHFYAVAVWYSSVRLSA